MQIIGRGGSGKAESHYRSEHCYKDCLFHLSFLRSWVYTLLLGTVPMPCTVQSDCQKSGISTCTSSGDLYENKTLNLPVLLATCTYGQGAQKSTIIPLGFVVVSIIGECPPPRTRVHRPADLAVKCQSEANRVP